MLPYSLVFVFDDTVFDYVFILLVSDSNFNSKKKNVKKGNDGDDFRSFLSRFHPRCEHVTMYTEGASYASAWVILSALWNADLEPSLPDVMHDTNRPLKRSSIYDAGERFTC